MKQIVKDIVLPNYEKIRRYVIGEVANAGDTPMRLASNREIARQFGVSHPTVIKALRELVAEGYLTVKPGCLGTFTNPGKFDVEGKAKQIGLVQFDGKTVFEMLFTCELVQAFSSTLLRKSSRYKIQNCFLSGSREKANEELATYDFEAIVWFFPGALAMECIDKLQKTGLTTVFADDDPNSDSVVYLDHEVINFEVASAMLAEGRRKIMLLVPEKATFMERSIAGVEQAFAQQGLRFDRDSMVVAAPSDLRCVTFEGIFKDVIPDGIIFNCDPMRLWKIVKSRLDVESGCRIYAPELLVYDDMDYVGLLGIYDMKAAGARMAECLRALIDKEKPPAHAPIGVKIEFRDLRKKNKQEG
jgi:hypothetical protein